MKERLFPAPVDRFPLHTYIAANSFLQAGQIITTLTSKEVKHIMARSNKVLVPDAKQNLDSFKMEVANSLNVNLKQGYNGDISAKEAGSVGGNMVKRMIQYAENNMNGGNNMMK